MNLKSTLALLVLLGAGIVVVVQRVHLPWGNPPNAGVPPLGGSSAEEPPKGGTPAQGTQAELAGWTPEKLQRLEIRAAGPATVLTRVSGGGWALPGQWPIRTTEVNALIHLLAGQKCPLEHAVASATLAVPVGAADWAPAMSAIGVGYLALSSPKSDSLLHSRFEPLPLPEADRAALRQYGLDRPAVTVQVTVAGKEHTLRFGEPQDLTDHLFPADQLSRLGRPTYLQLDDRAEALRLAPGLVSLLNRPTDYYQQRRLFPSERTARENAPLEKVERLSVAPGSSISVAWDKPASPEAAGRQPSGSGSPEGLRPAASDPASREKKEQFTLTRNGDAWKLTKPALDQPNPQALETLLTAVPDVWAERFVESGDPARFGLAKPERVLTVSFADGRSVILEIGASQERKRKVRRPASVGPMGFPIPEREEEITEEVRYARLKNNNQVFEIKGDRLKDIFVSLDALREPHIARFNSSDVQRVQITHKGREIVLTRDKQRWQLTQPIQADADQDKINDLLSKLAGLEAHGDNVSYNPNLKETGLDKPATTIVLSLEEEPKKGSKDKEKTKRTLTLELGKQEERNLYVREAGSPRVNKVEDSLATLAGRDVLAWRGKRLFDYDSKDLKQVVIQRGGEKVALEQDGDKWKLTAPVSADADTGRAGQLAGSLSKLEVLEFVDDAPSPQKLEAGYGLSKPELTVTLHLADKTRPARVLEIGRARGPGNGYFARLVDKVMPAGGDSVFAISNQVHDQLNRDSLAWRSKRILDLKTGDIDRLTIKRGDQTITLQKSVKTWRLVGPEVAVDGGRMNQMVSGLGNLEAMEFVTNNAPMDQLGPLYGLDKPALSVTIQPTEKGKSVQTVQFGKARGGKPGLFARLADSNTVFAVDAQVRERFELDPLTLLPKQLWNVPTAQVAQVKVRKGAVEYTLDGKGAGWQIKGPFEASADSGRVSGLLRALSAPQVESYKAFDAKDLTPYGLDKPALQVTVTDKAGKEHGLLLGGPTGPGESNRFGKTSNGQAIFVVDGLLAGSIDHNAFDLLNPILVQTTPGNLERIKMEGSKILTLEKKGKEWVVLDAPGSPFPADPDSIRQLEDLWQDLAADRYVAYGPKVKLAEYGLDKPDITLTIETKTTGARPETVKRTLQLGKQADQDGARYARLAAEPSGVVVLNGLLVKELTRGHLDYVNRGVLTFDALAGRQLRLDQAGEKVEAVKRDDSWMLTKPAEEKADDRALQQLWSRLADLRARRVAAYPAEDLKPFGLDMPAVTVVLTLNEDQKPAMYTLRIGKLVDAASGERFAQVEGSKAVVVLPAGIVRPLLSGTLALRDRTLAKFASADVLRLERDRRKATFAQVDGTWKLTEPLTAEADHDELTAFVDTLARLRADELVQEKPTPEDLKKYGLDKPEARWRALFGDREVLDLQIGSAEKDSPRRYARIAGKDLVFLLDPRLTARALGEFRPRAVWGGPLDASQIDSVRFGYAKNPFTLERSGGTWQVKEKPGTSVDAQRINETLAALAGLKLSRYVVDKGADLQIYGLKPPELVLEVTTRTGKRVLEIGGREGESQGRYAHLPEPGRTDVFLLSAGDAVRLVRDLPAFEMKGRP